MKYLYVSMLNPDTKSTSGPYTEAPFHHSQLTWPGLIQLQSSIAHGEDRLSVMWFEAMSLSSPEITMNLHGNVLSPEVDAI